MAAKDAAEVRDDDPLSFKLGWTTKASTRRSHLFLDLSKPCWHTHLFADESDFVKRQESTSPSLSMSR